MESSILTESSVLRTKCSPENLAKLQALNNKVVIDFITHYAELCNPDSIFVRSDTDSDADHIRTQAIEKGEESPLATSGHRIHFDGPRDQARDKAQTKYLVTAETRLSSKVNTIPKKEGLDEVMSFLKDSMKGQEMIVGFFCLGPVNSEFSIPCVQITDSFVIAHSEGILYRSGYEYFKSSQPGENFFRFIHTAGELENNVSKNVDKRRVYIDLDEDTVYSTNTQYAGNAVGLKKLAMRLAIQKASREGWLTEHMFIMNAGVRKNRDTYFMGAFPSACGKTSTSMLGGETIVGDDIAYVRKQEGEMVAANVEAGIFGIIQDVNAKGDPTIFEALTTPGEVIMSNVLVSTDNQPYWLGDGRDHPLTGNNYQGSWEKGKTDSNGKEVTPSHKNARYTISLSKLQNKDSRADDPAGVPISGIIYGGRDSDTTVPVEEAFSWNQGIITKGATIESETTAATLGQEGVRVFNPMSNLDFLSITLGKYIENNLKFADNLSKTPAIFSVNYFLKGNDGNYLNGVKDKHGWLRWMEQRVHGEVDAIQTPTGYIPKYEDLQQLFQEVLNKDYTQTDYEQQFTIRIPGLLAKIDRIKTIYENEGNDIPAVLYDELEQQTQRLKDYQAKYGDSIKPSELDA